MSFISHIKEEFQVIQERDPAIKTPLEVLLYPSFRVMIKYRRAHKLYLKGHYFLARWISQRAARKTGIEIHPGAKIGAGSVVIEEVPPNCTVVGIPGRVVRQKNMKVPRTSMDHCHLPDPVLDDLKTLQKEYTEVTNRLLEVEKELRFIKNKKGE